jgi:putative membrane protein
MANGSTAPASDEATVLARSRTEMARQRSIWAAERTLMGWIRTSLAMIGFGFSIGTFTRAFEGLPEERGVDPVQLSSVLHISALLVLLGTLALLAATIQHVLALRSLGAGVWTPRVNLATIVALLLVVIGAFALGTFQAIL